MEFTQEQIDAFKTQYPNGIYQFDTEDGLSCILHEPSRNDFAYILACKDEVAANELTVKQLWVAGDECIKEDFKTCISIAKTASDVLFKMKEVSLKKL